ncbi:Uncharacterized protein BN871_II_00160 [Paenibacillus sp. P22]|nr:Uncharacterized protein BN871_II_00160 [Paenibacillus sp. P22]
MLDLARADAERESSECAVRRRMLSPHTIVLPGQVRPISGPMTCTTPWSMLFRSNSLTPKSSQFFVSVSTCCLEIGSLMLKRSFVGTLWSIVANVRSGRRTWRPERRRPSNACGEVTSCTRCRSI